MKSQAIYVIPLLGITNKYAEFLKENACKLHIGDIHRENKSLIRLMIKQGTRDYEEFYDECLRNPNYIDSCVTIVNDTVYTIILFNIPNNHERDLRFIDLGIGKSISDDAKKKIINFWKCCTDDMYDVLFKLGEIQGDGIYIVNSIEIYSTEHKIKKPQGT